ncbi:MAG: DUF1080 domain-containing protein [Armatimonadetes bacterium]|nr:DUF1080 domain-containing protein [Armatimonadota bacterium]
MNALLAAAVLLAPHQTSGKWVSIFNGRNLDGWSAKIKGYKAGDDFGKTFRVEGGVIKVSYDAYGGEFKARFGHLFYKKPLTNYRIRLEYRFTGEQVKDGPDWAWRNSGIMLHCQDPKTMRIDQDFPVSSEFQLLGGPEQGVRHTGNVCTPGTNIVMDDKLITQHCTDSVSPTLRGDQWVTAEAEVHGNGVVVHRINGQEVLRYQNIQFDPRDNDAKPLIKNGKLAIDRGWISLQSESHPCEFRKIELMVLPR